jgi:hypothetical protein
VDRRRNPDKGWSHRDIGTREIRILEVVRTETSRSLETPGGSGPSFGGDTWRRSSDRRHIRNREIGVPEDEGVGTSKVSKSWRNRDRPSEKGRVATISVIGKSPDKEDVHRCWGHRDIGDPGDKLFVHFGIAKRETPISGGQLSARQRKGKRHRERPAVSQPESRDSKNRESRGRMYFDIANPETPTIEV